MKKRTLLTLPIILAAAGLGMLPSGPASAAQKHIGMMIWNTSVPFYGNLIKAAKAVAAKNNVRLDIQNGNGDLSTEISIVQQFIAEGKDMILIAPSDPRGIVPVIREANAASIPVIAFSTQADTTTGAKVVTYVGSDDYEFGKRQAQLVLSLAGEKARLAYVLGKLGTSSQIEREAGFMDVLKAHPGITIVARQAADWDNAKALAVIQDYLSKYPAGSLDLIVDQGPEGVTGANFAKSNNRTDIKFVLGDYPADVRDAILKGTVVGTVMQDPGMQGKITLEDAVNWLDGKHAAVKAPNDYLDLPIITIKNAPAVPPAWGG
ncbi:sugar ABC transporter substrate-binding protein [Acidisoma cellulosilytica]|uniref:Sugar ABC transporter substrate-binding protein n=1 Tax=Acidisoma cellulosilyticum TaxID=2802395 RepID=A0A963Z658_9PROT|nr:sugar ABC transporter substrate-binding protein [Acidisoma cellulosilyticum]MCB8882785.1 sugar ABC transporter substrate-binding protein [Acidisoma cellulosilyticum]